MTSLASIEDLENVIRTPIPPDGLDAAEAALAAASAAVRRYTRQVLSYVTDDQVLLSGGCGPLYLPELPVVAVSAVGVGGVPQDAAAYAWEASGLLVALTTGVPPAPTYWPYGYRNVVVTYDHGYVTIPDDVVNVTARVASRQYLGGLRSALVGPHAREADYATVYQGEGVADVAGAYGPTSAVILTGDERRALDLYRQPRFG